jgi:Leucine-rich repeat (LRR) protein
LSNCKLSSFHVGTLTELKELDLSRNLISELLGTGIEQLQNLVKVNVSHNKIVKKQNLRVFEYDLRRIMY